MGYARIFWVYEDDLRYMSDDEDASAIGRRVLELFQRGGSGYDHIDFPNSSPGVCQAGRFHATQSAMLEWRGNTLQRVKEPEPAPAAVKFWQMLTSRIDDVNPFGQRLLFHLPRSPMSAYRWGMIGAPCSVPELREAVLDLRRLHALDVLYSYIADYQKTIASLGPSPAENASHLVELAKLILDIKATGSLAASEQSQLRSIAKMLTGLFLDAEVKDYAEAKFLSDWVNDSQ